MSTLRKDGDKGLNSFMLQARLEECPVPAELEAGRFIAESPPEAFEGGGHRMRLPLNLRMLCESKFKPPLAMSFACQKNTASAAFCFKKALCLNDQCKSIQIKEKAICKFRFTLHQVKQTVMGVFTSDT